MEGGQHDLRRRNLLAVNDHVIHGNATAVVNHGDRVVDMDRNFDRHGVAGQRLVHGVVYNFVDDLVEAFLAIGADIHSRTQAHGFHPLEDFYVVGGVGAVTVLAVFLRFCLFGTLFSG